MTAIRKFAYDTVFDPNGAIVRGADGFRTQFTADEVAAARNAAFAEGRQAGEQDVLRALETLAASMAGVLGRLDEECRTLRDEAAAIALAAARKLAGAALDACGEERVLTAVEDTMETLRAAPRLVVRLAPALAETLGERLTETARTHGFDGALSVRADPSIQHGDITLDWAEGAIAYDREAAFARIDDLITRALSSGPDRPHSEQG
jgi:flagellar assembly protein FliH